MDSEIWKRLDETERAALYGHETIYKLLRDRNANSNDSRRARTIVGQLFSGAPLVPVIPAITAETLRCSNYAYDVSKEQIGFYLNPSPKGLVLSLVAIYGEPVVTVRNVVLRTTLQYPFADGGGIGSAKYVYMTIAFNNADQACSIRDQNGGTSVF